jgi:hypothetical protein
MRGDAPVTLSLGQARLTHCEVVTRNVAMNKPCVSSAIRRR